MRPAACNIYVRRSSTRRMLRTKPPRFHVIQTIKSICMKKLLGLLSFCFLLTVGPTALTSCSKKTGCPALEESTKAKLNKAGMPKRKSSSGELFKDMSNKKMKKKRKPKKRKY